MVKCLRVFFPILVLVLSLIYCAEMIKDYNDFVAFQSSEANGYKTRDLVMIAEREADFRRETWLVYLAFFVPSVLLMIFAFRKPTRLIVILLASACLAGLVMLGWYCLLALRR